MDNKQVINNKADIRIAPMIDWTDRHCRYFLRQISPNVKLYTEMITCGALLHGDVDRHLHFHDSEHPIALQLGGSNPADLAKCCEIAAPYKYDEINLNCGCPSDRVQSGAFGACLMKTPDKVRDCLRAMRSATDADVTLKCRIGVDEFESYDFLKAFIATTAESGCTEFIIHARKAWLKGLSPKQNREIPPLRYDVVHQLKQDFPELRFLINGGIQTLEQINEQLALTDGVMIGREAYQNPYILAEIERHIYGNESVLSRDEVALKMIDYARSEYERCGTAVKSIARHILGLYQGEKGAKAWRRTLSESHKVAENHFDLIKDALDNMHSKKEQSCIAA